MKRYYYTIILLLLSYIASAQVDVVEERLYEMALNSAIPAKVTVKFNDWSANKHMTNMQDNGSWSDITYGYYKRPPVPSLDHAKRFYQIIMSYANPESKYYHNAEWKVKIMKSADFFLANWVESGHWHTNEVEMVSHWYPAILLMKTGDEFGFTDEQIKSYVAIRDYTDKPDMSGVNKIYVNQPNLFKAAIEENETWIQRSLDSIAIVAQVMPGKEEGLKADMSWHQHEELVYFKGYGSKFITMELAFFNLASGTEYAFDDETTTILESYLLDGTQWVIQNASYDYGVNGRQVVLYSHNSSEILSSIKDMIAAGSPRAAELQVMANHIEGDKTTVTGNKNFWISDMSVQRGEGWYVSIRNTSNKSVSTETIQGENIRNAYQGLGSKCIMIDGTEYTDIFHAYDWTRVPGTTFEQGRNSKTKSWIMTPPFEFAGGVSNGRYGLTVYDQNLEEGVNELHLKNTDIVPVAARKLDLMTSEGVYSIGGGISATATNSVLTNINQCNSDGEVSFDDNGTVKTLNTDQESFNNLKWVHHDGVGYYFPSSQSVTVANKVQTGKESDVNTKGSDDLVERNVFSVWVDHGSTPSDDTYEYIILPGTSTDDLKEWENTYTTLQNDDKIQAVSFGKENVYGVAFYEGNETISLNDSVSVSSDKRCLLLIEQTEESIFVSVSDPSRELIGQVNITISMELKGDHVSTDGNGHSVLSFDMPEEDFAGSSVTQEYTLAVLDQEEEEETPNEEEETPDDEDEVLSVDDLANKLFIYPNPFEGEVNLAGIKEPTNYTVSNINGRILQEGVLLQNGKISLLDLPKGIYFIALVTSNNKHVVRLIKK